MGQRIFETARRKIHECLRRGENGRRKKALRQRFQAAVKQKAHRGDGARERNDDRREVDVSRDEVDGRNEQRPEWMRERLHPLERIPAKTESVDEVVDHPVGDERVLAQPRVLEDDPDEEEKKEAAHARRNFGQRERERAPAGGGRFRALFARHFDFGAGSNCLAHECQTINVVAHAAERLKLTSPRTAS